MIYAGIKDQQIFCRKTERNYDYVVIGRQPAYVNIPGHDNPEEWQAINWCGRLDLARKSAKAASKNYFQVEIIPVFEKSAAQVKEMKEDIDRQKRAEAEALQAYQEEEARVAEMEMYVKASQDEQDENEGYDAAIDAAFELNDVIKKEAAAREFEDQQKREAALIIEDREQEEAEEAPELDKLFDYPAGTEPERPYPELIQAADAAADYEFEAAEKEMKEIEPGLYTPAPQADEQPEKLGPVPYAPSLICKACGKLLSGPESIARGYGDKCWRKVWRYVRGNQEPEAPKENDSGEKTDHFKAREVRLEILKRIAASEEACICGEHADSEYFKSYDHDGGYMIPGYKNPQWIYTKCQKCGHELSLRKMHTVDIEDLETEGRREAGKRLAEEEARKAGQAPKQKGPRKQAISIHD